MQVCNFLPNQPFTLGEKEIKHGNGGGNSYARPQIQEFLTKKSTPQKKKKTEEKYNRNLGVKIGKAFCFCLLSRNMCTC